MARQIIDKNGSPMLVNGNEIWATDIELSDIEVKSQKDNGSDTDTGKRVIGFVGSTPSIDRDGDIIDQKGWVLKYFKKSSPVLWAHDHRMPAIARVNKFTKSDDALVFNEIEFPAKGVYPFADMIYELVVSGFIKAGSVGFLPIKSSRRELTEEEEKNEPETYCLPRNFEKQELIEFSLCNVGSNRDALRTHLGEKGFKTSGILKIKSESGERDLDLGHLFDEWVSDIEMDEEKSIEVEKDLIIDKPYPNEHACRLLSPDQFDSFRRQNNAAKHDGKRIDFIYGIKDGTSKLQAMRYPKSVWAESDAKNHCSGQNGSFEGAKNIDVNIDANKDIDKSDIVDAEILRLNDKSFLFELNSELEPNKTYSLEWKTPATERCFEVDLFVKDILSKADSTKIKFLTIPIEDITTEKSGAVLNKKNKSRLVDAQKLIGEVLVESEPADSVEETETELDNDSQSDEKIEQPEVAKIDELERLEGEVNELKELVVRLTEKIDINSNNQSSNSNEINLDEIDMGSNNKGKNNNSQDDSFDKLFSSLSHDDMQKMLKNVVNNRFDHALGKITDV